MTDDSSRGPRDAPTNNRFRRRHFLQTTGAALGGMWVASTASAASNGDIVDSSGMDTQAFDDNEWTLSWREEFDTGSINQDIWNFEVGNNDGWGNNELQYYQRENAWIENDQLVIEAREEQVDGYEYTSARMTTAEKYEKQYGRVDVRARLPHGQGIWPAIWMLGTDIESVGWPNCGEIDIMELIGSDVSTVHGTIHGPNYSGGNSIGGSYTGGSFADSYHVFQLTWYPDAIKFFVDGQQYFTVTRYDVEASGYDWVFDEKMFFLILNVAVGGDWPGYPDASTTFPQRMEVDYIRVYNWV